MCVVGLACWHLHRSHLRCCMRLLPHLHCHGAQPATPPSTPIAVANSICEVCVAAKLEPPPNDFRPFRYDGASCASVQQNIAGLMNAAVDAANIPMLQRFAPNSSYCLSGTEVLTCGRINNTVDLSALDRTLDEAAQMSMVAAAAGGDVCRPQLEGYHVVVETYDNLCVNFSRSAACALPDVPFPNCT